MFILIVIRQGKTLEKWDLRIELKPPCSLSLLCVLGKCENPLGYTEDKIASGNLSYGRRTLMTVKKS